MREIRVEDRIAIDASPFEAWDALKDPAVHARWHPFVTQIAGEHRLGQVRTCSVIVGRKQGETAELFVCEESTGVGRRLCRRGMRRPVGFAVASTLKRMLRSGDRSCI